MLALTPPSDDETVRTTRAPDGDAHVQAVALIHGRAWEELDESDRFVVVDAPAGLVLTAFGAHLRDTIAELDAGVLQDLAQPWAASPAFSGVTVDPVEVLIDLQHLCHHARATGGVVHGVKERWATSRRLRHAPLREVRTLRQSYSAGDGSAG